MPHELSALIVAAISIGFFHTLFGPDHYVPFVMLSWSRKWSLSKTAFITFLCGLGHILSSIVLGSAGIVLGIAAERLEIIESTRGAIAAWLLIAFGIAYSAWGIRQAILNKPHRHAHIHGGSIEHEHEHTHHGKHVHLHEQEGQILTPWVLFVIFVFGPCEPLIPLLIYPAARNSYAGVAWVSLTFGIVTIGTMLAAVFLMRMGLNLKIVNNAQRYTHAIAGLTILTCGLMIQFLGL
ncbi:MAG: urease accessory protein UreH domain-containing protein [Syntrophorhabdaceae bacterium]